MSTSTGSFVRPAARWCGGRRRVPGWSGIAAERGGGYDAGPASAGTSAGTGDGGRGAMPTAGEVPGAVADPGRVPFGLPVLAELPGLASVLEQLTVADRAQLAAVAELAEVLRSDAVEATTGVGVDHWLAAVATMTRMDRRLLVRTCRLLHRLPMLEAAVRAGRVSFAQLRGLTLALRGMSRELDGQVDRLLVALLDGLEELDRPDPDVLVRQVADAVDELAPDDLADRERDAAAGRYLTLQPRLDGTGGRFAGDLDAAGLALLDAATTPPAALVDQPGGYGAARADTLLARLASTCTDHHDHDGDGTGDGSGAAGAGGATATPDATDAAAGSPARPARPARSATP